MADYRVAHLDDLELFPWRETLTGRVRHELGIGAFGVNSWVGKNVGDRVIPEHAEDQPGDQEELYVVVRGRARFEVGDDTFDAPQGTLVFVPAGPNRRTAFAEEADTTVLAVGATRGQVYEPDGWEVWSRVHPLYEAGDYEAAIEQSRELVEASAYPAAFYNLACCEALAGRTEDAVAHLREAFELRPQLRELAKEDSDLDAIRDEPAFRELVG
jgi:tetratricopeptide (TPR) repeat protein